MSGCSPRTIENRTGALNVLHRFAGDGLDGLDRPRLVAFFETFRSAGRKPQTVHTYVSIVHRFLRWCVEAEVLAADPLAGFTVRMPKTLPRVPTTDEVRALIRACGTATLEAQRNRALVLLLADSGLRLSVAIRLRSEDLRFAERTVSVRQGKGGKDRTAFMGPVTVQALRAYLARRGGAPEDFVFCYRDGRPMNRRHALQIFHRLSKKAGLGWKIHPHSLRHFCGVSVLK
ncbi:MAG TPA: tyrosine-type recombinase/integrase, partial [bacterium]|nr:tyrosine-type recombinase/integrase [bacterium]